VVKKHAKKRPTVTNVCVDTEFTDYHGVALLFGLRRSLTYHLCNTEPALKGASISLKGANEARGKRLFNVAMIRRFLESKQNTP
jgi:hypothetical protein